MKKNKKNKGIIVTGGEFNAKNVSVGDNAKIEVNKSSGKSLSKDDEEVKALNSDVQKLIAGGKTKEAIELTMNLFKEKDKKDILKKVLLVSSQFNLVTDQRNLNLISNEDYNVEVSRINNALLHIIE